MLDKKIVAIIAAVTATAAFSVSQIYVPNGFEAPLKYQLNASIMKSLSFCGRVLEKLGLTSEFSYLRKMMNLSRLFIVKENRDETFICEDKIIEGVKVRIYKPINDNENIKLPLILHFHGGAYAFGSTDSYDNVIYFLAKQLRFIVVSVNYRLAPENPYPSPVNDCYTITKYMIQNHLEYNFDIKKIVLVGDSAGGHAVAAITQKLLNENLQQPKLQVLIYPRTQFYTYLLPSNIFYSGKDFLNNFGLTGAKTLLWHVGITDIPKELENAILANNHTLLVEDVSLRKKYQKYLDINFIPEEYKLEKTYYGGYNSEGMQKFVFPSKLDENSILIKNKKYSDAIKTLLTPEASPGLADDDILKKLPKAYFAVCEWDAMKDQSLIYAGRLRSNNVSVEIAYYEYGFHGIANYLIEKNGYKIAFEIMNGVVNFIKNNINT